MIEGAGPEWGWGQNREKQEGALLPPAAGEHQAWIGFGGHHRGPTRGPGHLREKEGLKSEGGRDGGMAWACLQTGEVPGPHPSRKSRGKVEGGRVGSGCGVNMLALWGWGRAQSDW